MKHLAQIILFLSILSLGQEVKGWGFYAHRKINYIATFSLPPELLSFYKKNIDQITKLATAPDQRRYMVDGEAPRHYMDIDHYGIFPYIDLPRNYDSAVARYSIDTILDHGIVPWHVQVMYYRLVKAFESKDAEAIIKTSAELGHYVADACVPLHASSNHNGQHTGQEGIHALWESRIPELFEERMFDLYVGHAYFISDIGDATWTMFLESAALSDTVLNREMAVTQEVGIENKYSIREKGANLVRSYNQDFVYKYMLSMDRMVEDRMRRAILATACYWMSAWIEAGQPDLGQWPETIPADTETEKLLEKWENGPGYGRSHE